MKKKKKKTSFSVMAWGGLCSRRGVITRYTNGKTEREIDIDSLPGAVELSPS